MHAYIHTYIHTYIYIQRVRPRSETEADTDTKIHRGHCMCILYFTSYTWPLIASKTKWKVLAFFLFSKGACVILLLFFF